MSNIIDERIVEMRFNNRQFEDGVQTSIRSLKGLKEGLNLEESAKSLSNLQSVGRRFSLSGISDGIETLNNKLSAIGIIGVTALQNITNSAINAGKRIASALTVDPIKAGFQEYETKMNAIQTILANTSSKGTTLDQVNDSLEELNKYADKTIYNFTEMTRNMGTFTAAGVDLDKSQTAIKGIANLAAVSGSNSQQASTAMYQLSQALSSGTVKLQDWNSVVNAGMGGAVFQDALTETARVHGVSIDRMIKEEGSFRETLQDGWLTSEILLETLSKFTGDLNEEQLKTMGYTSEQITSIMEMGQMANDAATKVKTFTQLWDTLKEAAQSGWTQSWETLIGDFEESKILLTEVSDTIGAMIGASADARNAMLVDWKTLGGRTAIIDSIRNAFEGVLSIIAPVKEAFADIFPPTTGKQLFEISEKIRNITENFKIGEKTSNDLKSTFKGLFAVLDIGKMAFEAVASGILSVIRYILPASNGILSFTGGIGDMLVALRDVIKESDTFGSVIDGLGRVIKPVADIVSTSISAIFDTLGKMAKIDTSGIEEFGDKMSARFKPLETVAKVVETVVDKLGGAIKKVSPIFYELANGIGHTLGRIGDVIANTFNSSEFNTLFDFVNTGVLVSLGLGLKKFIDSLSDISGNSGDILGSITGILDGVKGSLEGFQASLKANVLLKIAVAIGILSIALFTLSTIDSEKLTISLAAMSAMFVELFGSMAIFQKLMGTSSFTSLGKVTIGMIAMSTAILILSVAMKNLSTLDWDEIMRGLFGVAGLVAILVGASKLLDTNSTGLIRTSIGFIAMGVAIGILADGVSKLGSLDTDVLTKGLIGVGILVTELALFMKITNLDGMGLAKGLGMITLAIGINILADAVRKMGELNTNEIIKGLGAMGVLLTQLAIFINMTGNSKRLITTATGLVIIGGAMHIFASAIYDMGVLPIEQIGKGLLAMGGALLIVTTALNFLPKNTISLGVGLAVVAGALVILSKALTEMGVMKWEDIGKGLFVLASSLTILGTAMIVMKTALPGAAALLVISGALAILTPVLKSLGNMSLVEIGTALLTLVGTFVVLGGAALVLAPIIPALLALAGAISLLGVGVALIGGGIFALSAGLAALAISGTAGAVAIVSIVASIAGLIPMFLEQVGCGLIAFATVIGEGAPAVIKAAASLIIAISQGIDEALPAVVKTLSTLLTLLIDTLVKYTPILIDAGMKIILSILKGISDNIEEIIEIAGDIVINFIAGISALLPRLIQSGYDLIINFINGLADAIRLNTPLLIDAMKNLLLAVVESGIAALKGGISLFLDVGNLIMESGFIQGIKDKAGEVVVAVKELASKGIDGIKEKIQGYKDAGKEMVNGFINGIKDKIADVGTWGSNIGKQALVSAKEVLDIRSPSKVFQDQVGAMIGAGMAKGIQKSSKGVKKEASQMSKDAYQSAKEWIDERKYYNDLSLEQELYTWEQLAKKYKVGNEIRTKADKEIYRVKMEIEKAAYDHSIKWIDERKYYNELSLEEELAAWERVQSRYVAGSEERIKADKEIYRVKKELEKKSFDHSTDWIDERKYYSELSLEEELAAWKRVQVRYIEGTEERKKADREVYRVQKEINEANEEFYQKNLDIQKTSNDELKRLNREYANDVKYINESATQKKKDLEDEYYAKTEEINEKLKQDIHNLNKEYEDAVKSRTKTIYDSYSLFEKVDAKDPVNGEELITNLHDQILEMKDWKKNIEDLSGKGVDSELIKELTDMGPKSVSSIKALNSLSGEQLDEYVELWQSKHAEAKYQATSELEYLRDETRVKIGELSTQAKADLDAYKYIWWDNMDAITADTARQLKELSMQHDEELEELNNNTAIQLEQLKTEWSEKMGLIKAEAEGQVNQMSTNIQTAVSDMSVATETEFTSLSENIKKIMSTPDWFGVGASIVDGMRKGIQSKAKSLAQEAAAMAQTALTAAKRVLDINSPSGKFEEVGMQSNQGFANGLLKYADLVEDSATDVGNKAIEALSNTVSTISDAINSDMEFNPTISPVVDLTNVNRDLNAAFGGTPNINTSGIRSKASTLIPSDIANSDVTSSTPNEIVEINNHYVIHATIREEQDITKLSKDLYRRQQQNNRGKGLPAR